MRYSVIKIIRAHLPCSELKRENMRVGLFVDITENFEEKIRHAKSLGFDFGQLAVWDMDFYTDENLEKLKSVLDELDFTVTDLWCGWSAPVVWGIRQRLYAPPPWGRRE